MTQPVPLERCYRLLNHGPVVLVSTAGVRGPNVAPIAWVAPLGRDPALFTLVISAEHQTAANLRENGELVLNVPSPDLISSILRAGDVSGAEVDDKFALAALTAAPADRVGPPRVAEAIAWIEARVHDIRLLEAYDLYVVAAVAAAARPGVLTEDGRMDVERFPAVHHLGGAWFCTSSAAIRGSME